VGTARGNVRDFNIFFFQQLREFRPLVRVFDPWLDA
jgi:hypothetical protein